MRNIELLGTDVIPELERHEVRVTTSTTPA